MIKNFLVILVLVAFSAVAGLNIERSLTRGKVFRNGSQTKSIVASSIASLLFGITSFVPPSVAGELDMSVIMDAKSKLAGLESADETSQIIDGAAILLNDGRLENALSNVLNEKVPIRDGKERHNAVNFYAKSFIDDLRLVKEYYTAESIQLSEKAGGEQKLAQLNFAKQAIKAAEKEIDHFLDGLEPPQ